MGRTKQNRRAYLAVALAAGASAALIGCSSGPKLPDLASLNPFKKEEVKLPGKRVSVLGNEASLSGGLAAASQPVVVPAPVANPAWSQPGGTASNGPGTPATSGVIEVHLAGQRGARIIILRQADRQPDRL